MSVSQYDSLRAGEIGFPVFASQTRALPSLRAVATLDPVLSKVAARMSTPGSISASKVPDETLHMRTVSRSRARTLVPSRLNSKSVMLFAIFIEATGDSLEILHS